MHFDVPRIAISQPSDVEGSSEAPWIDRALIALPDEVYAVDVRPRSKTLKLLLQRLRDVQLASRSVFLLRDERSERRVNSTSRISKLSMATGSLESPIEVLHQNGAIDFAPQVPMRSQFVQSAAFKNNSLDQSLVDCCHTSSIVTAIAPATWSPMFRRWPSATPESNWPYLTHCTRGEYGRWPDQSEEGFMDDLVVASQSKAMAERDSFATLMRIVDQKRILATNKLKRSPMPTVSFSSVPLAELLRRRQYRSHLRRWDWEPYGICVQRAYLEGVGAREVRYLTDSAFASLDVGDQIYFQVETGRRRDESGIPLHRWTEEQEWRLASDLRLAEIPSDQAFLFAATDSEAKTLQRRSSFPVLSIESALAAHAVNSGSNCG